MSLLPVNTIFHHDSRENIEWCIGTLSSEYLVKTNESFIANSQENDYGNDMILMRFSFCFNFYHTLFGLLGYQLI